MNFLSRRYTVKARKVEAFEPAQAAVESEKQSVMIATSASRDIQRLGLSKERSGTLIYERICLFASCFID